MKNIFSVVFVSVIYFVFFSSCNILNPGPRFANIIIDNVSDFDIINISLTYHHGTMGEQIERIDILPNGEMQTITVITQHGGLGLFVTSVRIEYYIYDIKFDVNNEENADINYDGNIITRAQIFSGSSTKFIIKNEYYIVENL